MIIPWGRSRQARRRIEWAEHLTFVYPAWWGVGPARLKGLLDRVLLPGFAFRERDDGRFEGLLRGRTAHLITTLNTPDWDADGQAGKRPLPLQLGLARTRWLTIALAIAAPIAVLLLRGLPSLRGALDGLLPRILPHACWWCG